ncbi:MAG TPA: hypothetical protein VFL42_13930 [Terriglobales bacterium]|nr:hypothetical protein [Terriglobales bacterium]
MIKRLIALACIATAFAQSPSAGQRVVLFGGKTGLVLIAAARDGFAIATDGAQSNADGTISQAEKLFAIGKEGAVAIAGAVSVQDPVTRPVREEFDVAGMVGAWVDSHPEASLDSAIREISTMVSNNANRFFAARVSQKDAGQYKFTLVFAGYNGDKPVLTGTRYYMPLAKGKPMKIVPITAEIKAGKLFVFGPGAVADQLLSGTSTSLKKFAAEAAVKKYRSLRAGQLTAQDLGQLFRVILQATESPEGRKLSGKIFVAPPHKLGVIIPKQGVNLSK